MDTTSDVNLMMMNGSRLAIIHKRGYRPDISCTEVGKALERLGNVLKVTISTRKADIGAGRPVFTTFARRRCKAVTFRGNYGDEIAGEWTAVVSLYEWNSRYSFLRYALEQTDQLSTTDEVLHVIHARTMEEFEMKAKISSGSLAWRKIECA